MIYVTVGSQLPFDRLVRAVDVWADRERRSDVFAQIGRTSYVPTAIEWTYFLVPEESEAYIDRADLVVSHAGMGTILKALEYRTPIIVFPRLALFGEAVSDHQVATARHFAARGYVCLAENEKDLYRQLTMSHTTAAAAIRPAADDQLTAFLTEFVRKAYHK